MKAVLISIQPKWVEKIASGEKTIEVRKTAPKLKTPFKCFIYCCKSDEELIMRYRENNKEFRMDGKVIGEFICDKIYRYVSLVFRGQEFYQNFMQSEEFATCLTQEDLKEYGKGKDLYGWHISDLKIYDKPKELSEFKTPCKMGNYPCCGICDYATYGMDGDLLDCDTSLERSPQSWCYVEE